MSHTTLLRWVKAFDEVPLNSDTVHVRYGKDRNDKFMYKDVAYYEEGKWKGIDDKDFHKLFLLNLEWLEEKEVALQSVEQLIQKYAAEINEATNDLPEEIIILKSDLLELLHEFKSQDTGKPQPYGYVFENRFYKTIEELSGQTMSEGNVPVPVFSHGEDKW